MLMAGNLNLLAHADMLPLYTVKKSKVKEVNLLAVLVYQQPREREVSDHAIELELHQTFLLYYGVLDFSPHELTRILRAHTCMPRTYTRKKKELS
jgi:hypothetical protein